MQIPPPVLTDPTYLAHYHWMSRAIALAAAAGAAGEVPVGAVIIDADQQLIAEGENRRERDHDPTAHAEVVAIRQAGAVLGTWHLDDCILYVTLEPCPMCAGAIVQSRLAQVIYGTDDPKAGALRTVLNIPDSAASNHRPQIWTGILGSTCRQQLQDWFAQRRRS